MSLFFDKYLGSFNCFYLTVYWKKKLFLSIVLFSTFTPSPLTLSMNIQANPLFFYFSPTSICFPHLFPFFSALPSTDVILFLLAISISYRSSDFLPFIWIYLIYISNKTMKTIPCRFMHENSTEWYNKSKIKQIEKKCLTIYRSFNKNFYFINFSIEKYIIFYKDNWGVSKIILLLKWFFNEHENEICYSRTGNPLGNKYYYSTMASNKIAVDIFLYVVYFVIKYFSVS